MKRVFITGRAGSGKTRLSNLLSELANIPKTHIDLIRADTPSDHPQPKEYVNTYLDQVVGEDEWIIEGAHLQEYNNMMSRIDHLLVLDFGKIIRCRRAFMRLYNNVGFLRTMFPHEKHVFQEYRLVKQILRGRGNLNAYYSKLLNEAPDHVMCFYLNSDADVEKFIRYAEVKSKKSQDLEL